MQAVNGYYDGQNYIVDENVMVKPNQKVIITLLDENLTEAKNTNEAQKKFEVMKRFFGCLTHEEAESIRNNRVNFKERG